MTRHENDCDCTVCFAVGKIISRQVVATRIIKVGDEYVVKAYGQRGWRWPECDYFTTDKLDSQQTARRMIGR